MSYVLKSIDIETLLDYEAVDYKVTSGSRGEQLNVRECPACGDNRYKVYLNAETGYGNCFVCDKTYNAWTFISELLGTKHKPTIHRHIEQIADSIGYRPAKKKKVTVDVPKLGKAEFPYSIPLPNSEGKTLRYLLKRGVNPEYCARFGLRYCSSGYHVYHTPDGVKMQDFGKRVLIPISDLNGKMVTFQGRDITGSSDRKYLFPAQMPATGRFLYNGHIAYNQKATHIIINEGVFDVIAMQIACDTFPELYGIVPVGTFGKHLSLSSSENPSQMDALLQLKKNGLKSVTIMWDAEDNALRSALVTASKIKAMGLKSRIALLPYGKDPAECSVAEIKYAYTSARTYSRMLDIRWRIENPFETC